MDTTVAELDTGELFIRLDKARMVYQKYGETKTGKTIAIPILIRPSQEWQGSGASDGHDEHVYLIPSTKVYRVKVNVETIV